MYCFEDRGSRSLDYFLQYNCESGHKIQYTTQHRSYNTVPAWPTSFIASCCNFLPILLAVHKNSHNTIFLHHNAAPLVLILVVHFLNPYSCWDVISTLSPVSVSRFRWHTANVCSFLLLYTTWDFIYSL